jgi:hypothetical protein
MFYINSISIVEAVVEFFSVKKVGFCESGQFPGSRAYQVEFERYSEDLA